MKIKKLKDEYELSSKTYVQKRKDLLEKRDKKEASVERLQRQIERLENQIDKLERPSQHDVIRKLADLISEALGNLPYKISGPFGLCANTSIRLTDTDGGEYVLYLRPYDGKDEWITYDTGKMRTDHLCPPGSIGELNGMNRLFEPLPDDFEEVMKIVKASKYYPSGNCNV